MANHFIRSRSPFGGIQEAPPRGPSDKERLTRYFKTTSCEDEDKTTRVCKALKTQNHVAIEIGFEGHE